MAVSREELEQRLASAQEFQRGYCTDGVRLWEGAGIVPKPEHWRKVGEADGKVVVLKELVTEVEAREARRVVATRLAEDID